MKKWIIMAAYLCVLLSVTYVFWINKNQVENVGPNEEFLLEPIDSFEDICKWSDTIVKAKYVRKESFDSYSNIYTFKLENDYIGNVNEKFIHVIEDKETSFIRGKSYYLFLSSFHNSLYPYVTYNRTETSFLMGESTERNSNKYTFYNDNSFGLDKVDDISEYIEMKIIATNSYMQEERVSFEEAYTNADAIYVIEVEEVSPANRFVTICSYTITEKLRELYQEEGIINDVLPNTIGPDDAKVGDQFILFMKYNENIQSYGMYSAEEFLYPIDSSEAQYIINEYY